MDDFDDYLEYKMFEDSLKKKKLNAYIKKSNQPDSKYPPIRMVKKKSDLGCGGWIALICMVIAAISIFGSCSKNGSKSYSSSRSSYSSSRSSYSSTYRSGTSSSSSKSFTSNPATGFKSVSKKSKSNSSDPYDAKPYAHPEDLYCDYLDDFWIMMTQRSIGRNIMSDYLPLSVKKDCNNSLK